VLLAALGTATSWISDALLGQSVLSLLALLSPGRPDDQTVVAARNLVFASTQLVVMLGGVLLPDERLHRMEHPIRQVGSKVEVFHHTAVLCPSTLKNEPGGSPLYRTCWRSNSYL
jgi:hypothetical protein